MKHVPSICVLLQMLDRAIEPRLRIIRAGQQTRPASAHRLSLFSARDTFSSHAFRPLPAMAFCRDRPQQRTLVTLSDFLLLVSFQDRVFAFAALLEIVDGSSMRFSAPPPPFLANGFIYIYMNDGLA